MIVDEFTSPFSSTYFYNCSSTQAMSVPWKNDTHRGVIERRLGYKTVNVSRKRQSRLKRTLGGLNAILLNIV